uniref:Small ribosomal subunit protein uS3m n=1 Tax=Blastocladiella emersonii TaxID=4808 RepID=B6A7T2_BLAEM|nr:ribosomal protein [Blastocladiella emersonii]ABB78023.1 ribosomal protein [Blastocladiella emersonii]
MGRHIKRTRSVNWVSRNYINRRTEDRRSTSIEKTLRKLISYINPLLWGISKIEYHSLPSGNLKVIITGVNTKKFLQIRDIIQNFTINPGKSLHQDLDGSLPQVEFVLQELPYNYLDPSILAKSIAGKKNHREILFGDINFWSEDGVGKNAPMFQLTRSGDSNAVHVINGIRIEIKGITGKMTMSKKVIKTFGTLRFNSSDSVIDFGEARNFNKKGIIGVKVWIRSEALPSTSF